MAFFERINLALIRALEKLVQQLKLRMTDRKQRYVSFQDAMTMVYPAAELSADDHAQLQTRWNRLAAEKWAGRRRHPNVGEDGGGVLPVSEAVCAVVTVTRDWQIEEQQVAFRSLEDRLAQLKVFEDVD
jgi:hypothetical protein